MIAQSIRFTFAPDHIDEIELVLLELRDASRKEAGVFAFDVGRSRDNLGAFALWEVYQDTDGLEAHTKTEHFQRLVAGRILPMAKEHAIERVDLL